MLLLQRLPRPRRRSPSSGARCGRWRSTKKSVKSQTPRMSRMRDVRRQLLLAESGDAACLLEWCQVGLSCVLVDSVAVYSGVRVEAETGDRVRDPRRHELCDRLAARRRARGSPTTRSEIGFIANWTMRSVRLRGARRTASNVVLGDARRAWRRQSRTCSRTRSGDFQSREVCELVGAEDEDGVRRRRAPRARRRCERAVELDHGFRGRPRTRAARARAALRPEVVAPLCPGSDDDEDEELVEPELSDRRHERAPRGPRAADRRRRQEDALLPLERLLPDLDLRAALRCRACAAPPRARPAAAAVPTHAIAAIGAEDAEARPALALRRVVEELRQRLGDPTAEASTGQSSNRRASSSSIPAPVAHDVAIDAHDAGSSRRRTRGRRRGEIDLVRGRRAAVVRLEPGSVVGELAVDRAEALRRDPAPEASSTWTRSRARSRCARN